MKKLLNIFVIFTLALSLSSCGYNTMVNKGEEVNAKWSDVETQYQRRADLIPNLVNTVKGAADFERQTLTDVIEARSKATSMNINVDELTDENIQKYQQAQSQLSGALSRLLVAVERYPELKANQNFRDLQAQLEGTENRIALARKRYNESVQAYNAYIKSFPRVIYASWFNFGEKAYFKAEAGTEKTPEVSFE